MTVKANKSGWLQVKVDGNLVFQSILDKGVSETWQADREIEISGKNIHNLDYEVNGDTLGAPGPRGPLGPAYCGDQGRSDR